MNEPKQLDQGQKHLLKLIARERDTDGWAIVSSFLYKTVSENIPPELAHFEPTNDGGGRARLTDQGQSVLNAMAWLL